MAGNRYAAGSLHDVVFALDGVPEVVGARYLPLGRDDWEPALAEADLERLLGGDRNEGSGPTRPERTRDDGEEPHDLS